MRLKPGRYYRDREGDVWYILLDGYGMLVWSPDPEGSIGMEMEPDNSAQEYGPFVEVVPTWAEAPSVGVGDRIGGAPVSDMHAYGDRFQDSDGDEWVYLPGVLREGCDCILTAQRSSDSVGGSISSLSYVEEDYGPLTWLGQPERKISLTLTATRVQVLDILSDLGVSWADVLDQERP